MSNEKWTPQVGEKIYVLSAGWVGTDEVVRVGKRDVVLKNSMVRYNVNTGRVVGGSSWSTGQIKPLSDETAQQMYRKSQIDVRLSKVSMATGYKGEHTTESLNEARRLLGEAIALLEAEKKQPE